MGNKNTIGIDPKDAKSIIEFLNTYLASETVLYNTLRNYHWNVEGVHFSDLHALFESLYNETQTHIDEVAERIRVLGGYVDTQFSHYLKNSLIKEESHSDRSASEMLENLLENISTLIKQLRDDLDEIEDLGDTGSHDTLFQRMLSLEKTSWMIRSMQK